MAIDDRGSRCQNCIRLKKTCHFFPVDQPPAFIQRTRSGSKVENVSTDADTFGSHSSPGMGSADPAVDMINVPIEPLSISQDGGQYLGGAPVMTPIEKGNHI